MSCRTTPAGSAITSYARISDGPGNPLSDVANLSLFHELRRDYDRDIEQRVRYLRYNYDEEEAQRRAFRNSLPPVGDLAYDASEEDVYRAILAEQRSLIEQDTQITEARRASLLARLDTAENADVPDRATLYALSQMRREAANRRRALQTFLNEVSSSTGQDYATVANEFRDLENSIDRSRSADLPETCNERNIEAARSLGLGTETGTVHAFVTLRDRAQAEEVANLQAQPDLIKERHSVRNGQVPNTKYKVLDYGYDKVSGYIEFRIENTETGETYTEGYRGAIGEESLVSGMNGESRHWIRPSGSSGTMTPGEFWHETFHTRSWWKVDNELDRLRMSRAPRCARCGQWANNVHTCPTPLNQGPEFVLGGRMIRTGPRTSRQVLEYEFPNEEGEIRTGEVETELPLVNDYRRQFKEHGTLLIRNVVASIPYHDREGFPENYRYNKNVRGDIYLYKDSEGNIATETKGLRCDCLDYKENGDCRHIQATAAAAAKRAVPPQRALSQLSEEERARRAAEKIARIEAANATDWTTHEETMEEARKTWKQNSEVVYSEDFNSFYEVLTKASEEKAAKGSLTLPYAKENALGGLATRETGQAFGVEIEYDFPETMSYSERSDANEQIGIALKEANILPTAEKQGYHAAARNGYKDTHVDENGKGTWSWEHDATVAGEIVTPLMYDEPETWENLEKVSKILKEHGAVPTTKAGAHVHVGTARFGKDPKRYEELARLVGQHEDVLYRLSTDPERGEHRGKTTRFNYVSPISKVGPEGFQDANAMRRRHWQRTAILNISGAKVDDDYKSSHVEFRMFDATLDPAVMQNQIKLALNMTDAADRIAGQGGTQRPKESLGDHAERLKLRGRRKAKKEDIEKETSTFRSLLDTLYQNRADKDNAIRIFAANQWVKLTASQRRRYGSAA